MRLNGVGIGVLLALSPAAIAAQETRYRGICDASAAVALGPDHFVAAEDETETLVVFRRGAPDAVSKVSLCVYLGGHKGSDGKCIYPPDREGQDDRQETDIEGAARIGNLIYWIMSHGRNSDGDVEKARRRFFATEVVETGVAPTVKLLATPPNKSLLDDLLADDKFKALKLAKAAGKAPEDEDGLSIEGLAATPDGHLLIGFRNPIRGGKAIVIPLMNPRR